MDQHANDAYEKFATTPPFNGPGKLEYGLRLGNGYDFCPHCGHFRQYHVEHEPKTEIKRGIQFRYTEYKAVCCTCHEEIDVAEVHDLWLDKYWLAFYEAAYKCGAKAGAKEEENDMDKLDMNDIRRELLEFLSNDTLVWEVDEDDDRAIANDALYRTGAIDFVQWLKEKTENKDESEAE